MAEKRQDKKKRNLNKGESQLPDGHYMYRYVDMYGKRRKVYSWKLEATDTLPAGVRPDKSLREKIEDINTDTVNKKDSYTSKQTTLNERWEEYMSVKKLKKSTRSNYLYNWDKYVRDTLGQMKICDINSSIVTKFYDDLYEQQYLSKSTILGIHTLLYPLFEICIDDDLINKNPARRARTHLNSIEDEAVERPWLNSSQEESLYQYINSSDRCEKWKNLFTLLMKTGVRISEACGLIADDFDWTDNTIHIKRQVLYKPVNGKSITYVESVKTSSSERIIPIIDKTLKQAVIDEFSRHSGPGKSYPVYGKRGKKVDEVNGWLFRKRNGEDPLVENLCNDGLRRIRREYNDSVEEKPLKIGEKFTCHCFRHSFASKCEENGVAERAKKALLGHAPDKHNVTDRYVHLNMEYIRSEMKKIVKPANII